jgi:hypothetical protein
VIEQATDWIPAIDTDGGLRDGAESVRSPAWPSPEGSRPNTADRPPGTPHEQQARELDTALNIFREPTDRNPLLTQAWSRLPFGQPTPGQTQ